MSGSCRSALHLLQPLWWCLGLAIAMLVAGAPATSVLTASVDAATLGPDSQMSQPCGSSDQPSQLCRYDRDRRSVGERGALEPETSDDDEQPDTPAVAPDFKLTRAPGAPYRALSFVPAVDTGYRLVSTGLARGPPVVG